MIFILSALLNILLYFYGEKKNEDIENAHKKKGEEKHEESNNVDEDGAGVGVKHWETIEHEWINKQILCLKNENFIMFEK